jgi:hypothetical protein
VRFDFARLLLFAICFARILHVSEVFLLFGVHGNGRLPCAKKRVDSGRDVFKLGVPVGVLISLHGFTIRLKAIPLRFQQLTNLCTAHLKAISFEFLCQNAGALTCPTQRRHRVTTRPAFYQGFQGLQQFGFFVLTFPATREVDPILWTANGVV